MTKKFKIKFGDQNRSEYKLRAFLSLCSRNSKKMKKFAIKFVESWLTRIIALYDHTINIVMLLRVSHALAGIRTHKNSCLVSSGCPINRKKSSGHREHGLFPLARKSFSPRIFRFERVSAPKVYQNNFCNFNQTIEQSIDANSVWVVAYCPSNLKPLRPPYVNDQTNEDVNEDDRLFACRTSFVR